MKTFQLLTALVLLALPISAHAFPPSVYDFDGDHISDLGCYHPPSGNWYIFKSTAGFYQTQFGYEGTAPVTGDFDGDGNTDFGCYHAPSGNWYLFRSTAGFYQTQFGYAGTVPVTGDFDGDGNTDFGCYHAPSGNWYLFKSTEGFYQTQFGYAGTVPVTGDFDGDGKTDFGCYHAPSGNWYVFKSAEGFHQTQFGYAGTVPVMPGQPWGSIVLSTSPGSAGTVQGAGLFVAGSAVQISATPAPGWAFSSWSDGATAASRMITVAEGEQALTARFTALQANYTWVPGQSIGLANLGYSYATIKQVLGTPSEVRRTTNDEQTVYTLWTDYDQISLTISYDDTNGDGQLNDDETVDGLQSQNILGSAPNWTYQGITFGSSKDAAKAVLGNQDSFSTSTLLWWFNQGVMLGFSSSSGALNWIYVY